MNYKELLTLKTRLTEVTGFYFNGENIFAVNLQLFPVMVNDKTIEEWKLTDSAKVPLRMNTDGLSEKDKQRLIELGELDETEIDNETEDLQELLAEKIAVICAAHNWSTKALAFCLNSDEIINEFIDLSNVPEDKIANAVHYQIMTAGDFEGNNYFSAFIKIGEETWAEGISKIDLEKWKSAWQRNELNLAGLTAMPDGFKFPETLNLTSLESDFLERGGNQALFSAWTLALQENPNFLLKNAVELSSWNFKKMICLIAAMTLITVASILGVDNYKYYDAEAALNREKAQLDDLSKDAKMKTFIENDLAALDERNKILAELSKYAFPWRSLLIHFGTVKVDGVWLKEINSVNDNSIEIKCEAVSYEAMSNYVKALENDSDFFSNSVSVKNSETKKDGQAVQFVISLKLYD